MPSETYHITGYWPFRQEPLPVLAERVASLFNCLSSIDPVFERWIVHVRSDEPGQIMTVDAILARQNELLDLSDRYAHYDDDGRFGLHLTSANSKKQVDIEVVCGRPSEAHPIFNRVSISIDPYKETTTLLTLQNMTKVVKCIVDWMEPKWVSVRPQRLVERMLMKFERALTHPKIGWLTYLSEPFHSVPSPPLPSRAEPFADGVLITATDEALSGANPDHMALAEKLDDILVDAGIFEPGIHTDMVALENTPGVRIWTVTNPHSNEINLCIEPWGTNYPMLPGAVFKIVTYGDWKPDIRIEDTAVIVHDAWNLDVFYNDVKLPF